jgi:hypothetical protein
MEVTMKKLISNTVLALTLMTIATPLYAMGAYVWIDDIKNEFYNAKNVKKVRDMKGLENFDDISDDKGDVSLDCPKAMYIYGGRTALLKALRETRKTLIISAKCTKPKKLALFIGTVPATAGFKTKQIIMIMPSNTDMAAAIGEEYMYKFIPNGDIKANLYETIAKSQLKTVINNIPDD